MLGVDFVQDEIDCFAVVVVSHEQLFELESIEVTVSVFVHYFEAFDYLVK